MVEDRMGYLDNLSPNSLMNSIGWYRATRPTRYDLATPIALIGVGLVVGAGLALFLTPKTGRELRQDVSRQANRLGQAVRQRMPALPKVEEKETWENASSVP
jgi:hypothetical protein